MTATALEILLARLYGDSREVERFLLDRRGNFEICRAELRT